VSKQTKRHNYIINKADEALLARHADWWQRKGMLLTTIDGEPLGDLWLPLAEGALATDDMDLTPDMLDVVRLVDGSNAWISARALDKSSDGSIDTGPLVIEGDLFCTDAPYMRVPWVEAILGAPIRATIQGGSMRAQAFIQDLADWDLARHKNEAWLDLLLRLTELHVARSGVQSARISARRYAVTQTLMRGPSDLAEAILGPTLMSLSMYDHPQALRGFLEDVTDVFIEVLHAQLARIPPIRGGYVNPFGIWSPGTVVRTQCDAAAFLSPQHYAEWYLPYDVRISQSVDYSVIHLHSCSLHTVDALLEGEYPHAIQVIVETSANAPTLDDMIPVFRRILSMKPLIVEGPLAEAEVQRLVDEVPTDGLCIIARRSGW
jgi:hypothetical protein